MINVLKKLFFVLLISLFISGSLCDSVHADSIDIITGFSELDINDRELHFDASKKPSLDYLLSVMPDQLGVYLNDTDELVYIDVEWYPISGLYEESDNYYYQFSPKWDDSELVLADEIDLLTDAPYIGVFLDYTSNSVSTYAVTSRPYEPLIFEYLTDGLGFNSAVACGLMVNIYGESSFNPNNLQGIYEDGKSRDLSPEEGLYTDESYTAAVDLFIAGKSEEEGAYTNFVRDKAGYGLCQWTYWSRKEDLLDFCKSLQTPEMPVSISDYRMQLDFLMIELSSNKMYKDLYNNMLTLPNTVESAQKIAYQFCTDFESPAEMTKRATERANLARDKYWPEYGTNATPFEDIDVKDYYYESVLWAYESAIANGTSDVLFSPDATCTRAQALTFIWRYFDCPGVESIHNPFEDVTESDYFYGAVLWAVDNNITTGTDETHFSPDATVTRAQFVTFLYRAIGDFDVEMAENPFADVSEEDYFYKPVLWAVDKGVTTGLSDNSFGPSDFCRRCQVVTFLFRHADLA